MDENQEIIEPEDEETRNKLVSMRKEIMGLMNDFIRSNGLLSRLSMLKLHVNVSLVNIKPQQMLLSLVTPSNLTILVKLLIVCDAKAKIDVI